MDGVNEMGIGEPPGQAGDRPTDVLKTAAETLPAMARDQHHRRTSVLLRAATGLEELGQPGHPRRILAHPSDRVQQGVDHRVAGHEDRLRGHGFVEKIASSGLRRREMQVGHAGRQHAVDLFRKRRPLVEGPQARLDVADGDVPIEGAQGGAEHRRRVALHDHEIGTARVQVGVHRGDRPRGQIGERLVRPHQIEIGVRRDAEDGQHLIEHLAMLARDAHVRLELAVLAQGQHERAELDRLGARSEDEGNASSGVFHGHIHLEAEGFAKE